MERIAVAGATGRAGRHVAEMLEARGHEVVPMSRATGVDVITGDGLAEALTGADCIIDATRAPPRRRPRRRSSSPPRPATCRRPARPPGHGGW